MRRLQAAACSSSFSRQRDSAPGTIRRRACASSSCSGPASQGGGCSIWARARACSRWRRGGSARQTSRRSITTRTPLSTRARTCASTAPIHRSSVRLADLRTTAIEPADVVTANLTGALLVSEAARIHCLVKPGGRLILGGFVAAESGDVIAAYVPPFQSCRHVGRRVARGAIQTAVGTRQPWIASGIGTLSTPPRP